MKKLIFFSILLTFINCASQKTMNNKEIIYSSITRGRFEKIIFKDNSLTYKTHQKSTFFNLTKSQQEKINKEVYKINLNEINTLKAPTNKRLYDGAMHTSIVIKADSKEYTSTTFDHTNPPTELAALCNLLISLVKK